MLQNVVGAQFFTLREYCKDIDGIRESMKKVAAIGYKVVQISGIGPADDKEVAQAAEDNGLSIVATHVNWKKFQAELDKVIEQHKIYKCKHPAIGSLPPEYRSLDGLKRFVDEATPICEALAKEGMTFSYHNHNHEFAKYEGKTWLAHLYEAMPGALLKAELDVYWVQAGGGDPVSWICQCAGREPLLHLKDMAITPEREQRFAEIGEGNMNWKPILQAAQESGVEYYLVEQDQTYGRDPFESLAISYRYLNTLGLS